MIWHSRLILVYPVCSIDNSGIFLVGRFVRGLQWIIGRHNVYDRNWRWWIDVSRHSIESTRFESSFCQYINWHHQWHWNVDGHHCTICGWSVDTKRKFIHNSTLPAARRNIVQIRISFQSLLIEWRRVFWITFAVHISEAAVFTIWGSGCVQPWDSNEKKKKNDDDSNIVKYVAANHVDETK